MPESTLETPPAPPAAGPMPFNSAAEALEKAMTQKLSALLIPMQDGARATVTAEGVIPKTQTQPTNVPTVSSQPGATNPASTNIPPANPAVPDPVIPIHDQPPEAMSKAGKEDWHRFRALKNAEIDKRDKELATIRADLEKLKVARAIDPVEYETTKKTKEELEATVERLRLEESPKFKAYYDGGIEKQLKLVKSVGGSFGEELVKLIQSPRGKERNERLREIQDELGPEGNIIGNALGEITRLQHERGEQLSNWRENSKRLREVEQQENEASKSKVAEHRRIVADRLVSKLRTLPEFTPDALDKDHSAFTDSAITFVRNATEGKLAEEDTLLLPVAAMKAQYLETIKLPKLQAELDATKARLAELTGAKPQINGQQQRQPSSNGTHQRDENDPYGVLAMTKRYNELLGRT